MKRGLGWTALMTAALVAGCEPPSEPDAASSSSPTMDETAVSTPPASGAPVLKAASYPPRDDCSALPGWPAFRTQLEKAVAARDADALVAITDPAVELDFGGGAGVKTLRARLDDPQYRLWDELAAILPLGCGSHDGDGAAMPWIFINSPGDADAFTSMLVLGDAVPAYARPDRGAPVTATLDWPLVTVENYGGKDAEFTEVTLPQDAGKAFVKTAKLRSLVAYRLLAERTPQGWRITALIAGD